MIASNPRITTFPPLSIVALILLGGVALPSVASAASPPANYSTDYDFAESCAPTTFHDTTSQTPDVIVITDVSGSMSSNGGGGKTKMQIAKEAITELAVAVGRPGIDCPVDPTHCDDIRLGLGKFANVAEASIDIEPAEDSYLSVDATVNRYSPTRWDATQAP